MKRLTWFLAFALTFILQATAQHTLGTQADDIVGNYHVVQGNDESKVKFFKAADGTYTCQVYYLRDIYDKNGKKILDEKNPDKSLRNIPCDQIVLIKGLKYNAAKHQWDGAKIYDPQRGLRVNVTINFTNEGRLRLHASVLGIGETIYWDKIE